MDDNLFIFNDHNLLNTENDFLLLHTIYSTNKNKLFYLYYDLDLNEKISIYNEYVLHILCNKLILDLQKNSFD